MPSFRYSAYRRDGGEASGAVDADNPRAAQEQLKREGLIPRSIVPVEEGATRGAFASLRRRVPLPELCLMTRRLATLLGSAVPVYEAVATLHAQEGPGELRNILGRVRDRLAEGSGLAKALAAEPRVFSDSYVSMVAAGEASGALEVILERLAEFLEDQDAVRSKVVTSLAYPILMVVVGTGVMMFLLGFVVPKIVTIFEESKAALPLITVLLIKASHLVQKGWWALLLLAGAAVFAYRRMMRREEMRHRQDRLLLRLPLIGTLWQRLILSRFAKVLGLLLVSGVPVIKAMDITSAAVVNREYRAWLDRVKEELIEGGSLSASLGKSPLFPPLLVHMIAVGEKSGELEKMLVKAGEAFEREFGNSVTRLMALLEPLLVLGMGVCVGLVVVAVLLPIFELNQLVK
ncbi:MAG TPA: type II secretion system inner membrane protein GspF [Geobacteraceae bacterium]